MMSENILKKRLLNRILPTQDEKMLVLLTGARQTGKTTSVKMLYPDLPYYNLDAIEYREYLSGISTLDWGKTIGPAILDEIQKEPSLLDKVKFAYDDGQFHFSLLLSSAQILLLKKIKETLAGRILVFEQWPFCFCELLTKPNVTIQKPLIHTLIQSDSLTDTVTAVNDILPPEEQNRRSKIESYLLNWGGMPALSGIHESRRWDWLKSYNLTYLERDLTDLSRINDLRPFRLFHQITALRSAQLLSYSEISKDAGISIETVRRYIEYLKISYQIFLLQPYYRNLTSRVIKTPKVYWIDNGLWRQLSGIKETLTGQIYENYIVSEFHKYIQSTSLNARLYFYRTRSGLEVDLLIETPHGIIGCEIKSRNNVQKSDTTNLFKLSQAFGNNEWIGGCIIYRGNQIKQMNHNIWAIPSWRLFS